MKFFCLLLSVYVMLLSGIACADGIGQTSTEQTSEMVKETATYPVHSACCNDVCSPFCACACCVGFTSQHGIALSYFLTDAPPVYISHLAKEYYSIPDPLFQPPRAS